jgi:hypothetical protein
MKTNKFNYGWPTLFIGVFMVAFGIIKSNNLFNSNNEPIIITYQTNLVKLGIVIILISFPLFLLNYRTRAIQSSNTPKLAESYIRKIKISWTIVIAIIFVVYVVYGIWLLGLWHLSW